MITGVDRDQTAQISAGTNEAFNEVCWFYNGKYVIYNYVDDIWYYGNFFRTAWVDSGIQDYPISAYITGGTGNTGTTAGRLLFHEKGIDDKSASTASSINAGITSSFFDLDDGDRFMFVDKLLPDILFSGSDWTQTPKLTFEFTTFANSGSGVTPLPPSVGGEDFSETQGGNTVFYAQQKGYKQEISAAYQPTLYGLYESYTQELDLRFRGRQVLFKVSSSDVGTQWQIGAQKIRMRPDGRR